MSQYRGQLLHFKAVIQEHNEYPIRQITAWMGQLKKKTSVVPKLYKIKTICLKITNKLNLIQCTVPRLTIRSNLIPTDSRLIRITVSHTLHQTALTFVNYSQTVEALKILEQ
jgi:hypothetical protein